jgi:hypothetical protein
MTIAEKAADGPWITANQFGRTAIATPRSPYDSRNAIAGHYGITSNNAEFIAHARTSNPDLAGRVLALIKMVRERDERIGKLEALGPWIETNRLAQLQWADEAQVRGDVNHAERRVEFEARADAFKQAGYELSARAGRDLRGENNLTTALPKTA